MNDKVSKLQYYLLSARNPLPDQIEIHDKAFKFWLSIWKPTLAELKCDDSHLHEDFIRQDLVSCICYNGEVVGVLLFSFFRLGPEAVMKFRYMKDNFNDFYFKKIQAYGVQSVMSMQYLAVHQDWRGKKNPAAPISILLLGLAHKVRDLHSIDAAIAPARRDHGASDLSVAQGGDRIQERVLSHNVECDLIANIKGRTHAYPDPEIQNLIDYLWDHHINSLQVQPTRHLRVA